MQHRAGMAIRWVTLIFANLVLESPRKLKFGLYIRYELKKDMS